MRGLSAWCGCLLAAALAAYALRAAPIPSPEPAGTHSPPSPALKGEALNYARLLTEVVDRIGMEYVRPVSRADLAEAALTALYEAARQPVPSGLKQEVQQFADSDSVGLLTRAREELGPNDALRGNRALIVSVRALPKALDPYCGLNLPQESLRLDAYESTPSVGLEFAGVAPPATPIVFGGPGARIQGEVVVHDRPAAPTGPVRVQSVVPGGPGQRAGVRPGDLIVKIDGRASDSAAFPVLFRRLLPIPPGMPYDPANAAPSRLTILRPGSPEPVEVALAPAVFRPESVFGARRRPDGSWDFLLDPVARVGYIRLGAIGLTTTHTEFFDALKSLSNQSVRGLVLDLRWCPGGYLTPATTIAHLLLPGDAPVANQKKRGGQVKPVQSDELGASFTDFPVVVLVNGETSGGGELIAAALQDHGRAVIAGQRTVGKGSVQELLDRSPVPFKLTTGMFLRPSGKNLQRYPDSKPADDWGIRPDAGRDIPLTAEASRRLKAWWLLSTLRPAGSTEALPLDDPENDPQRQAAVQMLRGVMKENE